MSEASGDRASASEPGADGGAGAAPVAGIARVVNVHEAKTHLSRLLDAAHAGEEIILAKGGRPWARLVPLAPPEGRPLGFVAGRVPDSFFEPLPEEELRAWENL